MLAHCRSDVILRLAVASYFTSSVVVVSKGEDLGGGDGPANEPTVFPQPHDQVSPIVCFSVILWLLRLQVVTRSYVHYVRLMCSMAREAGRAKLKHRPLPTFNVGHWV